MMKSLFQIIFSIALIGSCTFANALTTEALETGCGIADQVYQVIGQRISEHSKVHLALQNLGEETGRRFYSYEDGSWFLTLEFFSPKSADLDVSCIVATGSIKDMEQALKLPVSTYPEWKWGDKPDNW